MTLLRALLEILGLLAVETFLLTLVVYGPPARRKP